MSSVKQKQTYIVLGSGGIGGCERRFYDIFLALENAGHSVGLILPKLLYDQLAPHLTVNRTSVLVVPMDVWNPLFFAVSLLKLIRRMPRGTGFHYPINCLWPLHIFRKDFLTMSIVECHKVPSLFTKDKHAFWHSLSSYFVKKVDVLSPQVFSQLTIVAGRVFSLTPGGTCVEETEIYSFPENSTVSLVSRLTPGKGIQNYLSVVESTSAVLRQEFGREVTFLIFGDGVLKEEVSAAVRELSGRGVKIAYKGYSPSRNALAETTVALSLQEVTNFPSRIVAESLMCGRPVVVTDVGDSREFGDIPGIRYVDPNYDGKVLAMAIDDVLKMLDNDVDFTLRIHDSARTRFSMDVSVEYFRRLFEKP